MEYKTLTFNLSELKSVDAFDSSWEVAGYASTFGGEPDTYGDVIARGAFLDSLAKRRTKLLWQHDIEKPIGKQLSLAEDDHGLFGRWSIVPTATGKEAHELLQADLIDSMSIGFMTTDADYREDGVRVLKGVDLFEVSLVTIPANANALITSFKAPDDIPFTPLLKRAQEALRVAGVEAKALHQRRQADKRSLNEKHSAAIDEFLAEAGALLDELKALRDVSPDVETEAAEMNLRLQLARHRLALRRAS